MSYNDIFVFMKERFAVGQEEPSGKYYISIPVFNGLVEYNEFYEVTPDEFERFSAALKEIRELAELSRARKLDDRLMEKPGSRRGSPI